MSKTLYKWFKMRPVAAETPPPSLRRIEEQQFKCKLERMFYQFCRCMPFVSRSQHYNFSILIKSLDQNIKILELAKTDPKTARACPSKR